MTDDEAKLYAVLKWRAGRSFVGMDAYARAAGYKRVAPKAAERSHSSYGALQHSSRPQIVYMGRDAIAQA